MTHIPCLLVLFCSEKLGELGEKHERVARWGSKLFNDADAVAGTSTPALVPCKDMEKVLANSFFTITPQFQKSLCSWHKVFCGYPEATLSHLRLVQEAVDGDDVTSQLLFLVIDLLQEVFLEGTVEDVRYFEAMQVRHQSISR